MDGGADTEQSRAVVDQDLHALWTAAAQRVFDDVERTTGLRWPWLVAVYEDEETPFWDLPGSGTRSAYASVLTIVLGRDLPPPARPRRRLQVPELWLDLADRGGHRLPDGERDLAHAVLAVLDDVQDRVIDELWTAWPPCPTHGHPLQAGVRAGEAVWRCPTGEAPEVPVGRLAGPYT